MYRKSIEFKVDSNDDIKVENQKKEVIFDIVCDYCGPQESKWNVIDILERPIFDEDNSFSFPKRTQMKTNYYLKV